MSQVVVNEEQCKLIAEKLAPLNFRKELLQREYLTFPADRETKLRVFLYSAAICHQTHTLINRRKNIKGWNCIEFTYAGLGKTNSNLIDPAYLATLSPVELAEQLKPIFSEDGNPENCTLDRLEERSQILINISKKLNQEYHGKIENLLEKTENKLINQHQGLYELLEKFPAFGDPLRKKSMVFIMSTLDANLLILEDPENMVPVMDYHMQRLLLRTGCVEIIDPELKQTLQTKKLLKSDEEIRTACVEAVKLLCQFSNRNVLEMDNFLWSLGRSCCRDKILCVDKTCSKNPCTFNLFVDLPEHKSCLFESVCKGKDNEEYRRYWQPQVNTTHY